MTYRYTVKAVFQEEKVAAEWLDWLRNGHCAEVLKCGASAVELTALDSEPLSFEVRYMFPDFDVFSRYESQHAPRLREEGLIQFPVDRGITYSRTTGSVIYSV